MRVTGADGVDLVVHHLGGEGPPVMLAHATGFHGRCWVPVASILSRSYTVWAIDQRGHGRSGRSPDGRYDDWGRFADDLLAAVDAVGGPGWRAGGHSLGGGVSLLAEARRPGTFTAICCYEPVVMPPPELVGSDPTGRGPSPLAQLARKRRPTFASRRAAEANYRSKPPFSAFDPEALRCYVEDGLVDLPDGSVGLACAREDEAAVFEGAPHSPTWDELPAVRAPVAVISGTDMSDPVARFAPLIARRLPRGGYRALEGLDHFGPMTRPHLIGEVMAAALAGGDPRGRSTIAVTSPK